MSIANSYSSATRVEQICLFIARLSVSAWIGAACLFVVVGVTEVTRGGFDSATKDGLVAVRFPAFYCCGALLVSTSSIATVFARNSILIPPTFIRISFCLLAIVLALMCIDYIWIYGPLLQMVLPPGSPKPAAFKVYHEASKWINLVELALCFVATTLLNWPLRALNVTRQTSPGS